MTTHLQSRFQSMVGTLMFHRHGRRMTKCITATAISQYTALCDHRMDIIGGCALVCQLAADLRQFSKQEINWLLATFEKSPLWSTY